MKDRKILLRARDEFRSFSSLRELINGGLKKNIIEIAGSDIYLRVRPLEEIFVVFEGESETPTLDGPVFKAELLGLTADAQPVYLDSLRAGFLALLVGHIDFLQLYEMNENKTRNHQILFLKKEETGQIQFCSGDSLGPPERFILTWEAGNRQGKVARFQELSALPAVSKSPAN